MPFVPNTPEAHAALLDQSSPTVCRGVSNDGKPCKRTLVRDNVGQPQSGIITIVGKYKAFFCNKHQDQAKDVVLRHTTSFARGRALVGRGSLDTLVEQVELLVGDQEGGSTVSTTVVSTTRKVPRAKDPFKPVLEDYGEEEDSSATASPKPPSPPNGRRQARPRKRPGFFERLLLSCCCMVEEDPDNEKHWSQARREAELRSAAAAVVDDYPEKPALAVRRKGKKDVHVAFNSVPPTPPLPMMYPPRKHQGAMVKTTATSVPVPARPSKATAAAMGMSPATPATSVTTALEEIVNPLEISKLSKQQQQRMSMYTTSIDTHANLGILVLQLIPKSLPAKGLARLQKELLKPFSEKDEPGYIYMFWLTDSPLSPFSTSPSTPSGITTQKPLTNSDRLLRTALNAAPTPGGTRPKLLFKIGRANNVQRRLHEWTTQCGHNLSLIRYYPHTSATSSPGQEVGRKVPNSHRIERLIHLELGAIPGANPMKQCQACGKTHKEWFEVDASRSGILAVDEAIKRWVTYGEKSASASAGVKSPAKTPQTATEKGQSSPSRRPKPPVRRNAAGRSGVQMYEERSHASSPQSKKSSARSSKGEVQSPATLGKKKKKQTRGQGRRSDRYDEDSEWSEDGDYTP
jgi:hypothetical protein